MTTTKVAAEDLKKYGNALDKVRPSAACDVWRDLLADTIVGSRVFPLSKDPRGQQDYQRALDDDVQRPRYNRH